MPVKLDSGSAFRQAGPKCFIKVCKARTQYAIASDEYIYSACGDHLSIAIREVAHQHEPPVESVEVFWR